jgi:hypothetical protein
MCKVITTSPTEMRLSHWHLCDHIRQARIDGFIALESKVRHPRRHRDHIKFIHGHSHAHSHGMYSAKFLKKVTPAEYVTSHREMSRLRIQDIHIILQKSKECPLP